MAQLPLITNRSVAPEGDLSYSNVQYSPESFGDGVGRALQRGGAAIADFAKVQKLYQDDMRGTDALDKINQAKDDVRQVKFDPNGGLFQQQGGQAQGSSEILEQHLQSIHRKYTDQIQDPITKQAFEKMWSVEREQAKDQVARHELEQSGVYKQDVTKATLIGSMQEAYDAYNDPEAIQLSIEKTQRAIRANSLGQPPAMVAAAEKEAVSSIHLAVISRYASEDPSKALQYYTDHKSSITDKDHITATQFTQAARDYQKANQWFAQNSGSTEAGTSIYKAIQTAESGNIGGKTSSAGALGLMQLMPETARMTARKHGYGDVANLSDEDLSAALLTNDELNQRLGQLTFDDLLKQFNGDVEAALVGYNAGPQGATDFLQHNAGRKPGERDYNVPGRSAIKTETEAYVQKVLGQVGIGNASVAKMTRDNWTLKNFQPSDLMAPTEDGQWVDARAAQGLDSVASAMQVRFPGLKISVNEPHNFDAKSTMGKRRGTSDPKDNPHVDKSQHIYGRAFDVQVQGWSDEQKAAFLEEARKMGFGGIGFYGPKGHLHIDMGTPRSWGAMPDWAKQAMQVPISAPTTGASYSGTTSYGGAGGTGTTPGMPGAWYADTRKPAIAEMMERSMSIVDTAERERVQSMIRTYGASQQAAIEASTAQLKNQAWQAVLETGDINSIPSEVVGQIGPELWKQLLDYTEKKAELGGIKTDDTTYSKLKTMPTEELAKQNPLDYRSKLADVQFREIANDIQTAIKAQEGDANAKRMLAGTQTRAQIVSNTFDALGWSAAKPGTTNAVRRSNFNQMLDSRMTLEATAKGRELTALETQDIVDKLLIEGVGGKGIGGAVASIFGITDNKAYAFESQSPDTFVSHEDWESVQPDDQRILVEKYQQNFGKVPDKETALDLYNRAFQVYLGGRPHGPDDEVEWFQQRLEQRLGYRLSAQRMEPRYGQWLLTFLGR